MIIAPSASEEALKITAAKQNVRVLTCGQWGERVPGLDFKRVNGENLLFVFTKAWLLFYGHQTSVFIPRIEVGHTADIILQQAATVIIFP